MRADVSEAREFALAADRPDPADLLTDVWATPVLEGTR